MFSHQKYRCLVDIHPKIGTRSSILRIDDLFYLRLCLSTIAIYKVIYSDYIFNIIKLFYVNTNSFYQFPAELNHPDLNDILKTQKNFLLLLRSLQITLKKLELIFMKKFIWEIMKSSVRHYLIKILYFTYTFYTQDNANQ